VTQFTIPACQSEGYGNADLMDIAIGLRAMVKGNLPEAKPQAPVVITEALPQSGPADYVARRSAQIKGSRFVSLARCEEQAWAELQWAGTNTQVWANSRAVKGMTALSSMEAIASSYEDESAPDEMGLFGMTEGTALDQLAADEETAWKVEAIRAALSGREWAAIQMKAEGLPDQVIANHLEASLPTAWKVIRKARAKAKAALA
jgi:hypothetical protein